MLKRTGKARGAIVLRAEEFDPDSTEASGDANSRKFFLSFEARLCMPGNVYKKNKKRDNLRCKNTEVCYNGNVTGKSSKNVMIWKIGRRY